MRQTLHIFRKDVRYLWPQIGAVLGLQTVETWGLAVGRPWSGIGGLEVISWWYLIAAAIHKESPTGDCQFWVTRPYDWKSLAAAKLLLIIAFLCLPLALSDLTAVRAQGLSPSAGSTWMHLLVLTALYVLPAVAIAAVTRYSGQMGLTILAIAVVTTIVMALGPGRDHSWGPMEWMHDSLLLGFLALSGAAVAVWQYARRRTSGARAALAVIAAGCYGIFLCPPSGAAVALLATWTDPVELRSVRLCAQSSCADSTAQPLSNSLPLRLAGLPPDTNADLVLIRVKSGKRDLGWSIRGSREWYGDRQILARTAQDTSRWVDAAIALVLRGDSPPRPSDVTVSMVLAVYRTRRVEMPRDARYRAIAGIGDCALDSTRPDFWFLNCRTPGYPEGRIRVGEQIVFGGQYESHNIFELEPILNTSSHLWYSRTIENQTGPLPIEVEQPIARIRRDITLSNVRPDDFGARR